MSIALLVITDGRLDCLAATIASARRALIGPISACVLVNDSLDPRFAQTLDKDLVPEGFTVLHPDQGKRGFAGAIRTGWAAIRELGLEHVFHLEDDFIFRRAVDLVSMAEVLNLHPHLQQLALLRQPWSPEEIAAGGIIQQHPDSYTEVAWGRLAWREHRRFFTTNPSLYRASLLEREWPGGANSEGRFGIELFAEDDTYRSAFWGDSGSGEWVTHIGAQRNGHGY